jgi:hypothetical protein
VEGSLEPRVQDQPGEYGKIRKKQKEGRKREKEGKKEERKEKEILPLRLLVSSLHALYKKVFSTLQV